MPRTAELLSVRWKGEKTCREPQVRARARVLHASRMTDVADYARLLHTVTANVCQQADGPSAMPKTDDRIQRSMHQQVFDFRRRKQSLSTEAKVLRTRLHRKKDQSPRQPTKGVETSLCSRFKTRQPAHNQQSPTRQRTTSSWKSSCHHCKTQSSL